MPETSSTRDSATASAPACVAKGKGHAALRIREIAKEHDVTIYEDPPLARRLFADVEIGDQIPEELYAAVAAVLSYVYRSETTGASA